MATVYGIGCFPKSRQQYNQMAFLDGPIDKYVYIDRFQGPQCLGNAKPSMNTPMCSDTIKTNCAFQCNRTNAYTYENSDRFAPGEYKYRSFKDVLESQYAFFDERQQPTMRSYTGYVDGTIGMKDPRTLSNITMQATPYRLGDNGPLNQKKTLLNKFGGAQMAVQNVNINNAYSYGFSPTFNQSFSTNLIY